jgi:hypothetical protein
LENRNEEETPSSKAKVRKNNPSLEPQKKKSEEGSLMPEMN